VSAVSTSLRGKCVVVTGASSGIGAQAAAQLARLGADVVLIGRDRARTAAVADALATPSRKVRRYTADFARLEEVSALAKALLADLPRIDVLVDNAGAALSATAPTDDGNEINYQVNALAPFLLTRLLAPAMDGGRIVSTSSRSHRGATLDAGRVTQQLDDATGLGAHQRYARAKLAALLLHREHRRRRPGIQIVDVHPGIVASDFGRYLGWIGAVLKQASRPLLLSPETAAKALVALAGTDELLADYYVRDHPGRPSALVRNAALAAAVYQDAAKRIGPYL
jgi:NAD(P)-dependent dehydrogenase (short-subunit alcohol dehydrogenase family)